MRTLEWSSKDTLIDAIGDDLNLDELIDDPFCNYSVENISGFYVKDDNEDSIALDFSIKRIDLMNSWDEVEQYFSGRIELEKKQSSEKIEVNISLNHTSNETKLVAEKILKNLNIHLKSQGHIKQDSEILKIQFNHFNNSGRIAFLEDIAKSHFQNEFYYQKIIDVDFYPDSSNSFPDDLKWLEKNIDELKLKGTLSE